MLIIIDFEAYIYEIIEFPLVIFDLKENKIINSLQMFVKPTMNPILDPSKNITSITQYIIDDAKPWSEVYIIVDQWIQLNTRGKKWVFVTDGIADIEKWYQMQMDISKDHNLEVFPYYTNYINLKDIFTKNNLIRKKLIKKNGGLNIA